MARSLSQFTKIVLGSNRNLRHRELRQLLLAILLGMIISLGIGASYYILMKQGRI